ncbi:hypothetical protein NDU88_003080 [Pleurodeles waltl]|uniref:Uncharacterized protein n=1 Tax=Pleurodeles waltl TaxID=8319 RepID=A0AAV7LE86_PLEWA|nr:hypothetical protein NDU88_003080 [Pleurodeles waltl]
MRASLQHPHARVTTSTSRVPRRTASVLDCRLTSSPRPCAATSGPIAALTGELCRRGKASPLVSGLKRSVAHPAQVVPSLGQDIGCRRRLPVSPRSRV